MAHIHVDDHTDADQDACGYAKANRADANPGPPPLPTNTLLWQRLLIKGETAR